MSFAFKIRVKQYLSLLPGSLEIEKSSRFGSSVKVDGSIEVGGGKAGGPPKEVADIMEAAWLTEGLR